MKRCVVSALLLAVGATVGWVVRGERRGPDRHEPSSTFVIQEPDAVSPSGVRLRKYSVYRITSTADGIRHGTPDAPPDGPRPTIVTLVGTDHVAYYGLPVEP